MKQQVRREADLYGQTFGSWQVLEYAASQIVAERGVEGSKRKDWARRASWHVECTVCHERTYKTTNDLRKTPPPVHVPCRKKFKAAQQDAMRRNLARLAGATIDEPETDFIDVVENDEGVFE